MTTGSREQRKQLVAEMVSWLEVERVALADAWARDGTSPTETVRRPMGYLEMKVERSSDRPSGGQVRMNINVKHETVEVSRLSIMANTPMLFSFSTCPPA